MKYVAACLLCMLVILHQDYWQWHRSDIVFGFIPYSLAYHMTISLATALVWILVVTCCWPNVERGLKSEAKKVTGDDSADKETGE